jgi:hypothetical protein
MAASVPERRIVCSQDPYGNVRSTIAIANSVRGVSWVDAAALQCWVAGRGSMDVPAHCPFETTLADTDSSEFRFWTKPRYQTTRYALTLVLSSSARTRAYVQFPIGGATQPVRVDRRRDATPMVFFADRSSQSLAEAEIGCLVSAVESGSCWVDQIQIEALPRGILSVSGSDLGANRLAFRPRQAIVEGTLVDQVFDRQNDLRDAARRVGLFQQSRGTNNPWQTSSGSYGNLFVDTVSWVPRVIYSGQTTYTCSWRVLAMCTDGSTAGDIRVSNSGGTGVSTITIPAGTTSWTWLPSTAGAAATFAAECEDNTSSTGLQSGAYDEHTFEFRRTAGAGEVWIATVSVFDAAQ